jgi:predicted signal transduction protein with EAL and GGDEF domain
VALEAIEEAEAVVVVVSEAIAAADVVDFEVIEVCFVFLFSSSCREMKRLHV